MFGFSLFKSQSELTCRGTCNHVAVQSQCHVQHFGPPWTGVPRTPLSSTVSQSLLKFMSIESVMLSNRPILCCFLLLLPSILSSIRVISSELVLRIRWPKYWIILSLKIGRWLCQGSGLFFFVIMPGSVYPTVEAALGPTGLERK